MVPENDSSRPLKASVVIPAFNAANTIQECLDALRAQECDAPYEIIVVDDGSGDETAEKATAPDIVLIRHEHKRGAAGARNSGIRAARGEIVCFTDADCVPKTDWICQLLRPFGNPDITGCKGTYETRQRQLVARFVQIEYEDKYDLLAKQEHINFIDTYSAAYRRPILLANEGFDEQFVFLEDQELSFRLASRGYQMVFQPEATVFHYHSDSWWRYFRKKFLIGYWKAQIVRRFPGRAIQDSHTPQVMKFQILLVALMLLALAGILLTKWSAAILAGLLVVFMISAAPFLVKAWKRDKAVALAAPFLLMTRATALGFGYAWGLVMPARTVSEEHTIHGVSYVLKRGMDVAGSFAGLIFTFFAGLFIAPAIKLDSAGPVIYKQERVGEEGRPFTLYKFRSMVNQPEVELATMLQQVEFDLQFVKPEDDPRLTRVGRFLRRWSLDELPQFWNVLRGDMSLVGPRPEETRFVEQYNDWQRRRLAVKPGMTGPMQVSGRADLPLDARVELELEYIENYTLARDLGLLLQTFPAVIRGKGAR